jgi:hypothetical protein
VLGPGFFRRINGNPWQAPAETVGEKKEDKLDVFSKKQEIFLDNGIIAHYK